MSSSVHERRAAVLAIAAILTTGASAVATATQERGGAASTQRAAPPPAAPQPTFGAEKRSLIVGTWRLNLDKSSYKPGPPPKAEVRVYEDQHEGIRSTITTTQADGRTTRVDYLASHNDDTVPIAGSGDIDSVGLKTIDPYTSEVTLMSNGKVIGSARRVISRDLKTMTVSVERTGPNGPVQIEAIYDQIER